MSFIVYKMKKLIIAEKPSVANDIARALGGFTKKADYWERDDFLISSAVGHLLELKCPESFEVKRGKWTFKNLPVIPDYFDLQPILKSQARLKVLLNLIKRKDVLGLINACDAGREGELIFNYITLYAQNKKSVERLWLQSMTPNAIREGFSKLRQSSAMQGLADAATCRSEADWLVGINGTRAMTAFNSKTGGFHLTTVGRVQTPTLAIVAEREKAIREFTPKAFWEVEAEFQIKSGVYRGKYIDPDFKKSNDKDLKESRLWKKKEAEKILQSILNKTGSVKDVAKPESNLSPLLFDLTSLQREANAHFGFSAKTTLALAQSLYEKHKLLTYPRTDSRALPEDYVEQTRLILQKAPAHFQNFAQEILNNRWVKPNKRIFNNAKISDHFAIIPTFEAPKKLNELEEKLYDFVFKRFLAVFYPAAEYLVTTRMTQIEGLFFKTEGKVLEKAGWRKVYGVEMKGENNLPPLLPKEKALTQSAEILSLTTKPPARFTEATLLSAMEGAGKMVDDEELKAAMANRGLGTPATRAQIIENLISEKYMLRQGRDLIPCAKAFSLMTLLNGLGITELVQPELTGEWEYKLGRMEKGEYTRSAFMAEIAQMTQHIVQRAKEFEADTVPGDFGSLNAPCPVCGGQLRESYKKFQCQQCDYGFWKIMAGRQLEASEAESLLKNGKTELLEGFMSKMGRPFSAVVVLGEDQKPTFDFQNESTAESAPQVLLPEKEVGQCPKCKARVFDLEKTYTCENKLEKKCDFQISRVILNQSIEPSQVKKLLNAQPTDLLSNFVSKRTHKTFSAFLKLDEKGNIGFLFEEKKPKKKKA